ncbi:MAG: hypothetical protein KDE14_14090, partial [Rhodobacteraceae bacterium]|nr:hypothetical protein [Paracoccaceae bacterium]
MTTHISRRTLVRDAAPFAAAMTMAGATMAGSRQAAAQDRESERARSGKGLLRLSANENPYGPSDSAKAAMLADMDNGWMYATGEIGVLTDLIAEREGVTKDHVLVTEGSAEVLRIAALVYASRGKQMVAAAPTFEQA